MKKRITTLLAGVVVIVMAAASVWAAPFVPGGLAGNLTKTIINYGEAVELTVKGGKAPYSITLHEQGIGLRATQSVRPEGGGEWKLIRSARGVNTYELKGLKAGEYNVEIQDSKGEKQSVKLTVKPAR